MNFEVFGDMLVIFKVRESRKIKIMRFDILNIMFILEKIDSVEEFYIISFFRVYLNNIN